MSIDDELEELEDLEMIYESDKRHSPKNNSACCLLTLCCLPFQLLIFLIKSYL